MIVVSTKNNVTIEKGIQTKLVFAFLKNSLTLKVEQWKDGNFYPTITVTLVELVTDSTFTNFSLYRANEVKYKLPVFNAVTVPFDYTGGCFAWMENDDAIADMVISQIDYISTNRTPPATVEDLNEPWYYGLTASELEKTTINGELQY